MKLLLESWVDLSSKPVFPGQVFLSSQCYSRGNGLTDVTPNHRANKSQRKSISWSPLTVNLRASRIQENPESHNKASVWANIKQCLWVKCTPVSPEWWTLLCHNSGNALRFITFHSHNQVLSTDLVPGTVQVTCIGLLFLESHSNFLKYCFPLFTKKNRRLVQGHTVISGRAETEISSDWTLAAAAAEGLMGMLGLTSMSMAVRWKGIIFCFKWKQCAGSGQK